MLTVEQFELLLLELQTRRPLLVGFESDSLQGEIAKRGIENISKDTIFCLDTQPGRLKIGEGITTVFLGPTVSYEDRRVIVLQAGARGVLRQNIFTPENEEQVLALFKCLEEEAPKPNGLQRVVLPAQKKLLVIGQNNLHYLRSFSGASYCVEFWSDSDITRFLRGSTLEFACIFSTVVVLEGFSDSLGILRKRFAEWGCSDFRVIHSLRTVTSILLETVWAERLERTAMAQSILTPPGETAKTKPVSSAPPPMKDPDPLESNSFLHEVAMLFELRQKVSVLPVTAPAKLAAILALRKNKVGFPEISSLLGESEASAKVGVISALTSCNANQDFASKVEHLRHLYKACSHSISN